MRFTQVDRKVGVNSAESEPIKIKSGFHETAIYFFWWMGSSPGLASALATYAAASKPISWTLRFEALAGEIYRVMAGPKFSSDPRNTMTLSHVNLWVEDSTGSTPFSGARESSSLPARWASS